MSTDYLMKVKSIGLSKIGGRKPCTLSVAAKHNKRELAHELEERGRIVLERTPLNYSIAGALDSTGVVAKASQLMANIGISPDKMRRDYCQAVEIVFSLPANTTIDIRRYFVYCFEWCCTRFGAENILSFDVHLDESTPHCHALIAPIQSGRWVSGKLIDRTNTKVMNESFLKQVASVYGLKRGDRLTGSRKGEAVAIVLGHIENHDRGLFQSLAWQPLRHAIELNPAPFLTAYGIDLENKPTAKLKTMAQIFTSAGKGAKRETLHLPKRNPIGIEAQVIKSELAKPTGIQNKGEEHQSLSCVGIANFQNNTASVFALQPERPSISETELEPTCCGPVTVELLQSVLKKDHDPKES